MNMNQLTANARLTKLANGRAPELLVGFGAAAILACDLIDPTLDARIYAASEQGLERLTDGGKGLDTDIEAFFGEIAERLGEGDGDGKGLEAGAGGGD